jgi:hypothetical protein
MSVELKLDLIYETHESIKELILNLSPLLFISHRINAAAENITSIHKIEVPEKQESKFNSRYKKLIKMKQICDAHSEKWNPLNSNPKQNSKPGEEYEKVCQSLVEKLDILLADYDAFYEEFFIDIYDCYFCCFEEDYEDQILNRFEEKINHITTLRDDLYKIYLGLI